ncbi:helix-turn-helix domain-containing protein [Hylemonella gracilis]|uniref:Helix-turn-helix domain protein n=1 Tax=Hylemonella gracilis ATCC 19624 TaxID=887062 RepID=F3KNQ5_9BURK|nr:helix-turn-helix transcriptional regulator [Hylemonella gracilis]EGI78621.1 helix-turn-helix domain protein [Hylemonella gracilis ATCC 19624]
MAQLASLLKAEIVRLARKEVRAELQALQKASSRYRTELAALKRQIKDQQRQLAKQAKSGGRAKPVSSDTAGEDEDNPRLRFRASGFATLRKKLDLSAADMGKLVGVTQQTVYHWEKGQARPRASQLQNIAAIRKLGKRGAAAKLAEM